MDTPALMNRPVNKRSGYVHTPTVMHHHTLFFIALLMMGSLLSCAQKQPAPDEVAAIPFDSAKAGYLYQFAYSCIDREYLNKPGLVLGDESYLAPPRELHPAFYGCFDWHSAVHGHWTLVTILSKFPDIPQRDDILEKLTGNITRENIQQEMQFFDDEHNRTFQRTYGWAWLLKLAHLDRLNFSRAWCLFEMGHTLNNHRMLQTALDHFHYSYEKMDTEEYAGSHWLASFATYAILKNIAQD